MPRPTRRNSPVVVTPYRTSPRSSVKNATTDVTVPSLGRSASPVKCTSCITSPSVNSLTSSTIAPHPVAMSSRSSPRLSTMSTPSSISSSTSSRSPPVNAASVSDSLTRGGRRSAKTAITGTVPSQKSPSPISERKSSQKAPSTDVRSQHIGARTRLSGGGKHDKVAFNESASPVSLPVVRSRSSRGEDFPSPPTPNHSTARHLGSKSRSTKVSTSVSSNRHGSLSMVGKDGTTDDGVKGVVERSVRPTPAKRSAERTKGQLASSRSPVRKKAKARSSSSRSGGGRGLVPVSGCLVVGGEQLSQLSDGQTSLSPGEHMSAEKFSDDKKVEMSQNEHVMETEEGDDAIGAGHADMSIADEQDCDNVNVPIDDSCDVEERHSGQDALASEDMHSSSLSRVCVPAAPAVVPVYSAECSSATESRIDNVHMDSSVEERDASIDLSAKLCSGGATVQRETEANSGSTDGTLLEKAVSYPLTSVSSGDESQSTTIAGMKGKLDGKLFSKLEGDQPEVKRSHAFIRADNADDGDPVLCNDDDSDELELILSSYVVVSKEDVPDVSSAAIAGCLPPSMDKHVGIADRSMEVDERNRVPVGNVCTVGRDNIIPSTEDPMAKAYGDEDPDRPDHWDASSTVVEVGSVAESDVTLSRGFDLSDILSVANSADGESLAADFSANDSWQVSPIRMSATSARMGSKALECLEEGHDIASASGGEGDDADVGPVMDEPVTNGTSTSVIDGSDTDVMKDCVQGSAKLRRRSAGLLDRIFVSNPGAVGRATSPGTFSIVSYNVLAECHRVKGDYTHTPERFLLLDYRHCLLMRELKYLDSDIVCLQEVEPTYYNTTLLPAMYSLGYEGSVKYRTREDYLEGEATFVRSSRFEVLSSDGFSLAELAIKQVQAASLTTEVRTSAVRYLDRFDVVLVSRLRCKLTDQLLVVGNIHVMWDERGCPDVACVQTVLGIREVLKLAGTDVAHIMCGDFNSNCSSPAYQLMLDGELSEESLSLLRTVKSLQPSDDAKCCLVDRLPEAFRHSAHLASAYLTVGSEPPLTFFCHSRKTVDYILYCDVSLVPVGVLKTVDEDVVTACGGLPNEGFPSDHLSLKAVMAFAK